MTSEELKEYNKLTAFEKILYNQYKALHPGDSHSQALTYAKICGDGGGIGTGDGIGGGGTVKEIVTEAVRKAKDFIRREIPRIFNQVRYAFENLLNRLAQTVEVTWDAIKKWFNDIF